MAAVLASMGGGGGSGGAGAAEMNMWNFHQKREEQAARGGNPESPRSPRSPRSGMGSPRKIAFGRTAAGSDAGSSVGSPRGRRKRRRRPLRVIVDDDSRVRFEGGDESDEGAGEEEDVAARVRIGGEADISQVVAYAKILEHDRSVRRRNLLNLTLAILCAFVFMFEIWMAYDIDRCWGDWPIPGVNPATGEPYAQDDIDVRVKDCLQRTDNTWYAKCVMSGLTGLLAFSIVDYYRMQLAAEKRYWFMSDSFEWRRYVVMLFLVEMAVVLPHPFPLPDRLAGMYDDKLGAFMFCRVYLFFRVLRDHSPIYKQRKILAQDQSLKKSGAVEFNWLLSTRFLFMDHMWAFVVWSVIIVWACMAYVIWIFEREHNINFTLEISVWFACITMTTVGYGDVNVSDGSARIVTGFTVLFGLILGALLAYVVMFNLTLSPQDVRVRNLWAKKSEQDKQRRDAAAYIALAWDFYKEKRVTSDRRSKEFREAKAAWNVANVLAKSRLRSHRREITMANELDDFVITRLETRMDEMTEEISERLAYRLGMKVGEGGDKVDEDNGLTVKMYNIGKGSGQTGGGVGGNSGSGDVRVLSKADKVAKFMEQQQVPPNHCLGMLATVSKRIDGMEEEQDVTIRELDRLIALLSGKGWW